MTFQQAILAGAIGGLITSVALPLTSYFILRFFHKVLIFIKVEEREESNYKVYNIRIRNCPLATLKNVIAHVSIDNHKNDIVKEGRIKIFCSDAKVERGTLSWSKNFDNKNLPELDINQGEEQDINLIRFHIIDPDNAIEIASEQGFFDEQSKNKSRTVLTANRNYILKVLITGENFWPKKKAFTFNHDSKQLIVR